MSRQPRPTPTGDAPQKPRSRKAQTGGWRNISVVISATPLSAGEIAARERRLRELGAKAIEAAGRRALECAGAEGEGLSS